MSTAFDGISEMPWSVETSWGAPTAPGLIVSIDDSSDVLMLGMLVGTWIWLVLVSSSNEMSESVSPLDDES
jgi:hypothetical protein